MDRTVLSLFKTACLFAGSPFTISPVLLKAIMDGVVREPSEFGITSEVLSGFTQAIHEFVVPKSIPTTYSFAI
jgi:hypothetical protein